MMRGLSIWAGTPSDTGNEQKCVLQDSQGEEQWELDTLPIKEDRQAEKKWHSGFCMQLQKEEACLWETVSSFKQIHNREGCRQFLLNSYSFTICISHTISATHPFFPRPVHHCSMHIHFCYAPLCIKEMNSILQEKSLKQNLIGNGAE